MTPPPAVTVIVTLAVRSDCLEYLDATPGESRERNLADMLDSNQATIVYVRKPATPAELNEMWKMYD